MADCTQPLELVHIRAKKIGPSQFGQTRGEDIKTPEGCISPDNAHPKIIDIVKADGETGKKGSTPEEQVQKVVTPLGTSYYDIPVPENAPDIERRICQYLEASGVHMSHPSMRHSLFRAAKTFSQGPAQIKANFVAKRNRMFSQSFKMSSLTVAVPTRPRAQEAS